MKVYEGYFLVRERVIKNVVNIRIKIGPQIWDLINIRGGIFWWGKMVKNDKKCGNIRKRIEWKSSEYKNENWVKFSGFYGKKV